MKSPNAIAEDRELGPLTDRTVAGLRPQAGRRFERMDGKVQGLAIRVASGGRKTWTLTYRIGRRQRRWTMGTYPVVSLASARKKARLALTQVHDGIDPAEGKRVDRERATFDELAATYLKNAKVKKKSWAQDDLLLRSILLPAWGRRALKDIKRRDVKDLLGSIVDRGKPVMANRVQALISTVFNFAIREEWTDNANPAALIVKQTETSRTRVLTGDEIRALWTALDGAKVARRATQSGPAPAVQPMIAIGLQVQAFTAQRPGEVFTMKWADLDLAEGWEKTKLVPGWWTIPAGVAKNKQAHRVPLLPQVVDLLRAAKAIGPDANRWVFAGEKGASVAARASKAMGDLRRAGAIDFHIHRHDLRRTAATGMASAGISRTTIAHVLNHVDRGSRATQIYDRYDHDAEKRVALETWARRVDDILAAREQARVVPFGRG